MIFSITDIFADEGRLLLWESQNRNTQNTPAIKNIIKGHHAILFARIFEKVKGKTQPFVYVGRLTSKNYQSEKTVHFLFNVDDFVHTSTGPLYDLYHWNEGAPIDQQPPLLKAIKTRSQGQGRMIDPKKKKSIELHAMLVAKNYYENLGYQVTDTSANCPYDFECDKNGELKRIEVKGTTMGPQTVNVTFNEVKSARADDCETDLFIVHAINVEIQLGEFIAEGGKIKLISNWKPKAEHLTPTAYTYRVPEQ